MVVAKLQLNLVICNLNYLYNMKTDIELFVVERAKELRINNNLSQADLAFKMNLSVGFIGKVESKVSSTKYNLNHINKLALIFNVSPREFLPNNAL